MIKMDWIVTHFLNLMTLSGKWQDLSLLFTYLNLKEVFLSYIDWIRSRVGKRKIFLAFGTVIVEDENGRFLLQRRTDFDFWGLPGGVLELDEDIETCTRRELKEETGLLVADLSLVGVYTDPKFDVVYPNGDQVQIFTICFRGRENGGVHRPDGVETSEQCYFSFDEIESLDIPVWYRAMLKDFQQGGKPSFLPPFVGECVVDQIVDIRPFIGTERLIAVGATAVVLRDDGRVLMVRRQDNKQWALPSGYSDLGENVAHTAVRETLEETGMHIAPEKIMGVYSSPLFHHTFPNGDQVKNVGVLFRAKLLGGNLVAQESEIAELAWMTPSEILQAVNPQFHAYATLVMQHLDAGYFII